ncbi:hypothetical protein [Catellatospora sp. IY07-71]|uniref:hypothetical protein n=1 Tax=Catellatospora sp. IY07-71 TaxID=2728827 RepID=UPI001BB34B5F|nr:hypothetical protein [Catellatospora sp. IY07-71]
MAAADQACSAAAPEQSDRDEAEAQHHGGHGDQVRPPIAQIVHEADPLGPRRQDRTGHRDLGGHAEHREHGEGHPDRTNRGSEARPGLPAARHRCRCLTGHHVSSP